jgi:hypothetical protein
VYRKGKGPKNEGEAASSPMAAVAAKKAALEF